MKKPQSDHPWKSPEAAHARLVGNSYRSQILVAEKIIEALEAEGEVVELIKNKGFLTTEFD